jgi:hypothetical protein
MVQTNYNYAFVIARPVTDFLSKMDDFLKTHGDSTEPLPRVVLPLPIAPDEGILLLGGTGPGQLEGNIVENSYSVREDLGTHGFSGEEMVFVEAFLLPLCPKKILQSIRIIDIHI